MDIGRLNGVIAALETGKRACMAFMRAEREEALAAGASALDGIVFEMEHAPWDAGQLRDALQHLINRRRMIERGTLAPVVTPFVRIPANGGEMNQWLAKQALDAGVYGVVWPHIDTADQATNAVTACRYARPRDAALHEPGGQRGDGPVNAARYWGLTQNEYYTRADVWPLNPMGEILIVLMIESVEGMENLSEILKVPGVGAIMIGEGDLSQQLGHPRDYEHPKVRSAMARIVEQAIEANIPVAHPHVSAANAEQVVTQGFRILFTAPTRSFAALEKVKTITGA